MTATDDAPVVMTGPTLADHAGITYRQLDHWVRQGWLRPAHVVGHPSRGTGHRRVFMGLEIVKAEHMGRLVNLGARPAVAAEVAWQLAEAGTAMFGPYRVTYEGAA